MLPRIALIVALALSVCSSPLPPRLEGYDVILCSGNSIHSQLGISLEDREYGMSDFRFGFSYCSTEKHHCMRAPLLVSLPKESPPPLGQEWVIDGVAFRYAQEGRGFQILAVEAPESLIPGMESIYRFSANGDLLDVTHRSEGEVEVQTVCQGRINISDVF